MFFKKCLTIRNIASAIQDQVVTEVLMPSPHSTGDGCPDDADGCPALAPPKPLDPAKIGPTASYFGPNIQYYLLALSTLTSILTCPLISKSVPCFTLSSTVQLNTLFSFVDSYIIITLVTLCFTCPTRGFSFTALCS
jgi:hypothetical protein